MTSFDSDKRKHRCCFTGHRPQKLKCSEREAIASLESAITDAVGDGYTTFLTGMAYGVDIWAGEIVCRLRDGNDDIRLIAAVPFPGFERRWQVEWKRVYWELLEKADLVRYVGDRYSRSAYQERNEWMVDRSNRVIAVYSGIPGGTRNTIEYARRKGIEVVVLPA